MGVRPRGPKIPQAEISQIPESGWGDLFDRFLNTSPADSPPGIFWLLVRTLSINDSF